MKMNTAKACSFLSRYYIAVLTLISFSLVLQIVAGVLIIIIGEPITLWLIWPPLSIHHPSYLNNHINILTQ